MKPLKMAVVGVGALGRHHARILSGMPNVDLVGVIDNDPDQGQKIADNCECDWYADDRQSPHVDAAVIAVPTQAHLDVTSAFLRRGTDVLVEKPLAPNAEQARRLLELAESNECVLQVGHVERFNPATRAARSGITRPQYIRAERVSPYTFRSTDIGVVLDLMIHDIDLVLSFVDSSVETVEAFGMSVFGDTEDVANARLRFENGCIVDLTASRVCPTAARQMQIWSARGCTTIDFATRNVTSYRAGAALLAGAHKLHPPKTIEQRATMMDDVFGKFITVDEAPVDDADALTAELVEFTQCVRDRLAPTCGGPQAVRALETAERIVAAVQSHPTSQRTSRTRAA